MAVEKYKVLIRADAGAAVGSGHLMRMLALAGGCRKLGFDVTFAVGDIPGRFRKNYSTLGVVSFPSAASLDLKMTRQKRFLWQPKSTLNGWFSMDTVSATITKRR